MKRFTVVAWVTRLCWVLFLVTLPVTNFPYFPPSLGGDALVRPLALYPLIALLFLVTIPRLLHRAAPRTFYSILPFVIVACAASLLSLLSGTDSLLGVSIGERTLRALITLGVGLATYFTVTLMPQSREELRGTLRWIYLGSALAMAWGSLQAVYVIDWNPELYAWAGKIQSLLTSRALFENRISGPTYEPNWFAKQICLVTLPWLLAAIYQRDTVFPRRWGWLTVEWLLAIWSVILVTLTFSRAGIMLVLILVFIGAAFLRLQPEGATRSPQARPARPVRRLIEAILALSLALGSILILGSNNAFFSRLWNYWREQPAGSVGEYFEFLGFGSRVTFGVTAYRIFEDHPMLGVGLGNYAFYFEENLPDRLLAETPEVLNLLTQNASRYRLITPKNLYLRILAETGLVGFGAFLAFIVAIAGSALALWLYPRQAVKYWGAGGLLTVVSFAFLGLSFDSFAFPELWVSFGMISAAVYIFIVQEHRPAVNDQAGIRELLPESQA
jgi:O-antigen ligase